MTEQDATPDAPVYIGRADVCRRLRLMAATGRWTLTVAVEMALDAFERQQASTGPDGSTDAQEPL